MVRSLARTRLQHPTCLRGAGSEDCLYANIYVPEEAENTTLPVMFWIYGGGFDIGDGYEFGWYRGKHMAANRRVIVVEFNYRLGSLGFLSHPVRQLSWSVCCLADDVMLASQARKQHHWQLRRARPTSRLGVCSQVCCKIAVACWGPNRSA